MYKYHMDIYTRRYDLTYNLGVSQQPLHLCSQIARAKGNESCCTIPETRMPQHLHVVNVFQDTCVHIHVAYIYINKYSEMLTLHHVTVCTYEYIHIFRNANAAASPRLARHTHIYVYTMCIHTHMYTHIYMYILFVYTHICIYTGDVHDVYTYIYMYIYTYIYI